jgi:pimeloyl-CoA synthetase
VPEVISGANEIIQTGERQMREVVRLSEVVKRKVEHYMSLTSFKIFAALIIIELVYSAGKDFTAGYIHGAMSVMAT